MSDSAPFPVPDVYYRLQSVSLVSYLDLYDIYDDKIVARPLHDGKEQKWLFIAAQGGYMIVNAATYTGGRIKERYLSIDLQVTTAKCTTEGKSSPPTIWKVTQEEGEGIFSLTSDSDSGDVVFLSVDPDIGKASYNIEDSSKQINLTPSMKWRIPEATPSVPKDIYRIRTWLGLALHAEPKGDVLSVEKLEKKQHEEWEVQPVGNGLCVVKSVSAGSFLGWETGDDGITKAVLKGKLSQEWIFKNTSEGFSITTSGKPLNGMYGLALSNGDTSELYMKPIKATQNQIWFLEAANVSMDNSDDGPSPQTSPATTAHYPEIEQNTKYLLMNAQKDFQGKNRYISTVNISYPSSSTILSISDTGIQMDLTYRSTDGKFVLADSNSQPLVRTTGAEVKLGATSDTPTEWILQRVASTGDLASHYFICVANQNLVLSGTTHLMTSSYNSYYGTSSTVSVLTIAVKQEGDLAQMWKFLA